MADEDSDTDEEGTANEEEENQYGGSTQEIDAVEQTERVEGNDDEDEDEDSDDEESS